MNKLDETAVEYFDDTEHKAFLLDVIDVLERHHHTSKAKIDTADQKRGLVWNWLNTAAKSFNVDKILKVLRTLNLLENKYNIDKNIITESLDSDIQNKEKAILLQIQSISLDRITNHILEKIPTAKWIPFKNGTYYIGKIIYETTAGFVELLYRTDGMIIATLNNAVKRQCYTEEMLWNWINAHGYNVTSKCPITQTAVKTLNKKSSINFLDLIKGI